MIPRFYRVFLLGLLLLASGCSATTKGMTVDPTMLNSRLNSSLAGEVSVKSVFAGGSGNDSHIDRKAFEEALVESLRATGLLSVGRPGRYELTASVTLTEQTPGGLSQMAKTEALYVLVDSGSKTLLLNETVAATGTATFDDSVMFLKRYRLAAERAIRNSILALVEKLNALKVPPATAALR